MGAESGVTAAVLTVVAALLGLAIQGAVLLATGIVAEAREHDEPPQTAFGFVLLGLWIVNVAAIVYVLRALVLG